LFSSKKLNFRAVINHEFSRQKLQFLAEGGGSLQKAESSPSSRKQPKSLLLQEFPVFRAEQNYPEVKTPGMTVPSTAN
jgi:hypothetical protein